MITTSIRSLNALKRWNKNPTEKAPIVLEWFLEWFFEKLLDKDKIKEAIEARETLIEFTMICEKIAKEEATQRVDGNFFYFSGYSTTRWRPKWIALEEQLNRESP